MKNEPIIALLHFCRRLSPKQHAEDDTKDDFQWFIIYLVEMKLKIDDLHATGNFDETP